MCLLDIKVKEKSVENLIRGRDIYEVKNNHKMNFSYLIFIDSNMLLFKPPRYMTVAQACSQIIEILSEEKENKSEEDAPNGSSSLSSSPKAGDAIDSNMLCVGLARVGRGDQRIRVDTIANMSESDLGAPLHSLILVGKIHPMEAEYMRMFYEKNESSDSTFENLVDTHNKFYKC